jgi:hypothetical protein
LAAVLPLLLAALVAGGLPSGPALAASGQDTPWTVTRKADNRVLPKQDSLSDIESGLADPDAPQAETAEQPRQPEQQPPPAARQTPPKAADQPSAKATPKPAPKAVGANMPAMAPGKVGRPEFDADFERVVAALPLGSALGKTRVMNLDGPRRVVVDFYGAWDYSGPKEFPLKGDGVAERAAIGVHPDFLRLVLHLTRGTVPASIEPEIQAAPGGVVVTVPLIP